MIFEWCELNHFNHSELKMKNLGISSLPFLRLFEYSLFIVKMYLTLRLSLPCVIQYPGVGLFKTWSGGGMGQPVPELWAPTKEDQQEIAFLLLQFQTPDTPCCARSRSLQLSQVLFQSDINYSDATAINICEEYFIKQHKVTKLF